MLLLLCEFHSFVYLTSQVVFSWILKLGHVCACLHAGQRGWLLMSSSNNPLSSLSLHKAFTARGATFGLRPDLDPAICKSICSIIQCQSTYSWKSKIRQSFGLNEKHFWKKKKKKVFVSFSILIIFYLAFFPFSGLTLEIVISWTMCSFAVQMASLLNVFQTLVKSMFDV